MSEKSTYSIGEIVRLKSGGPDMTVNSENKNMYDKIVGYTCQWFAGKKLEKGSFPTESLEPVTSASDS